MQNHRQNKQPWDKNLQFYCIITKELSFKLIDFARRMHRIVVVSFVFWETFFIPRIFPYALKCCYLNMDYELVAGIIGLFVRTVCFHLLSLQSFYSVNANGNLCVFRMHKVSWFVFECVKRIGDMRKEKQLPCEVVDGYGNTGMPYMCSENWWVHRRMLKQRQTTIDIVRAFKVENCCACATTNARDNEYNKII